ncbi:MAG: hypothetical protein ACPG8V_02945 [Alphaproteobacteria bacterium]
MALKNKGAKIQSGFGNENREFEPIDIFVPLWRFIKQGRLAHNSEQVVMKYAIAGAEPRSTAKDFTVWKNVLDTLKPILINKRIVERGTNE